MSAVATHRRVAVIGGAAALMLLPLLAIRAADPAAWEVGDLMFLLILLGGIAAAYELSARVSVQRAYASGLAVGGGAALLQAWINLAVGIVGSAENPANLIYVGVLAVAVVGAAVARFEAAGMARAMAAAAVAQLLAFAGALVSGLGFTGPITIFFVALWLISASLFRRAASTRASAVA